jgi:hypothetical protein
LRDIGKNGAGSKHDAQYLGKENNPRSAFILGVCDFLEGTWMLGVVGISFSVLSQKW